MVGDKGYPAYQGYLNDRCVTIAEALKLGGYRTLMSGKWHVGEDRPHWPTDRGFDKYFGLISGGGNYFDLAKAKAKGVKRQMAVDDQPYTPPKEGFYITDAFSDNAAKFIDSCGRDDKPFFLYLPYTAPHWPLHEWPDDIAKYKGKYKDGWDKLRRDRHARMIEMGIVSDKWKMSPRDTAARLWADLETRICWILRWRSTRRKSTAWITASVKRSIRSGKSGPGTTRWFCSSPTTGAAPRAGLSVLTIAKMACLRAESIPI